MVTINKQNIPPEVVTILDKLAKTDEFNNFFDDGDVNLKEAKYMLSSDAGENVNKATLDSINQQLTAVGEAPMTIDDLALLYESFKTKFESSSQPFSMPNGFNTQQLDRARSILSGPPLKVETNLTPAAQRYANDPEFKSLKLDLRRDGLMSADQARQICNTKIVKNNPDVFIRDVVIPDSGMFFNPEDGEAAATLVAELAKANASDKSVSDMRKMYSNGNPTFILQFEEILPLLLSLNPKKPLTEALKAENIPHELRAIYSFKLSPDKKQLTVDPLNRPPPPEFATRGVSVTNSAQGGKIIELDGGPFKNGTWVKASFEKLIKDPLTLQSLGSARYDLKKERDILVVNGEKDAQPTLLVFSLDPKLPGLVSVCSEVGVHDFNSGGGGVTVRKPVIYLYPETKQNVRVTVDIKGEFLVRYPMPEKNTWDVIAQPDGVLFDRKTERKYSYLFWEAKNPSGFVLDPTQSFLVRGEDAALFMEQACSKFGLNEKETTDFITYWLPALQSNPFNLVQFINKEYEQYAPLFVEPKPETVIRMFMIFKQVSGPVPVGAPQLPNLSRKGFTVVEWGGTNLDEIPKHPS